MRPVVDQDRARRATEVSREAMFTVGPNTSPSRATTSPYASPPRTEGNSSSASSPRSVITSAVSAAAATSLATKSTSSPMFLMTRPPWSTTMPEHSASKYSIHCTSSVSLISLLRDVKPTMSTNATASRVAGDPAVSTASSREPALARCRRQT